MKDNLIQIPQKQNITNLPPIKIEDNNNNYYLNIDINNDLIMFSINDKEQLLSPNYVKTMTFQEIKDLNKGFSLLNSINEFYDYLKVLSDNKKINIKKSKEKISIILSIEVLLKKEAIEINLYPGKIDLVSNIKNIYEELINIKEKIKDIDILKNENKEIKEKQNELIKNLKEKENEISGLKEKVEKQNEEIEKLKKKENEKEINELKEKVENRNKEINILKEKLNEINVFKTEITEYLLSDKSVIMKYDERSMIFSEIESKMNKKISKIKKLYQATIDGGEPINFHSKCDNIENTLILIKSEGNRRFGGFTPIAWTSSSECWKKDPSSKTFVFSLDKKKIYSLISGEDAVYHNKDSGPCFGGGRDIAIDKNPIKENTLFTYQSSSYDYKGDQYSLSENNSKEKKGKVFEYEVFQVIFF